MSTPTAVAVAGGLFIVLVLWDIFETIVLPRSFGPGIRLTRLYYKSTWWLWSRVLGRLPRESALRDVALSVFGPYSLLALITCWSVLLISGFALLLWGAGAPLAAYVGEPSGTIWEYLYLSGVTFFTLGYGDITPKAPLTRLLCVLEAGTGFAVLAVVIGYLPVMYQSFSEREGMVLRAYQRAGEPSSAAALLARHARARAVSGLTAFFEQIEGWCADLMESYRSYPMLAFYRSQRGGHSWLEVLVTSMDASAVILCALPEEVGDEDERAGELRFQAELTLDMGRAALIDLADVLTLKPYAAVPPRLTDDTWDDLLHRMDGDPLLSPRLRADPDGCRRRLQELRARYEPWARAAAEHLLLDLPPWVPDVGAERRCPGARRRI